MRPNQNQQIVRHAFTLIEVLLAVMIFAVVLLAINSVFFGALRLERATTRLVDERQSLNHAFSILRRDLMGAVPPKTNSTLLPRNFVVSTGGRGLGATESSILEFYTTTGQISDAVPWGDVQRIRYELVSPLNTRDNPGQELVRIVARNILATTTEEEEEQLVLGGVQNVEFLCYDGDSWVSTWDTSGAEVGLPTAVRVRLELVNTNNPNLRSEGEPLELLVPITTLMLTNEISASTNSGGGL